MIIPIMSLLVVINGPVANAGSIPYLSKTIGINVPINEATTITLNKAIETVIPMINSYPSRKCVPKINITAKILPFNKLNDNSFNNRVQKLPVIELLAKP